MPTVTVSPEVFEKVNFDAAVIAELARRLAAQAGVPDDAEIHIEVDESSPLGRTSSEIKGKSLTIQAMGGAFEDTRHLRKFSEPAATEVLGRLLYQAADRLSGRFDGAPSDADLTLPQRTVWDAYAMGRLARTGAEVNQQRRRYHFRTRHGFTDLADTVFERIWNAESLAWPDVEAACAETEAARLNAVR